MTEEQTFKYGFRYDPMKFVEEGDGLHAALVRKQVLGRPKEGREGDEGLIRAEIDRILEELGKEGALDEGPWWKIAELIRLGCPPDEPAFRGIVTSLCERDEKAGSPFGTMAIHAALYVGWRGEREPAGSLERYKEGDIGKPLEHWCPWEPAAQMPALSAGRELVDVGPAIDRWLTLLWENTNEAGCWNKLDPWNVLEAVAIPDHPLSRRMVERYVPMILRSQGPDGGWDRRSAVVFRALTKHGLMEPLRKLPPLPPDWRIVRSVPAPEGDLWTMTWGGGSLWVLDREAQEAIAVSPVDGTVVKRLDVTPRGSGKIGGLGWWKGLLAVTAGGTEHHGGRSHLVLMDPESGEVRSDRAINAQWGPNGSAEVGGEFWIAHGCWMCVVDPASGSERPVEPSRFGSWPVDVAAQGRALWHTDEWAPFMFKSDLDGNLLEFLDQPFFAGLHEELPARGIAFDGKQLWALDDKNKRICIIEKNDERAGGAE